MKTKTRKTVKPSKSKPKTTKTAASIIAALKVATSTPSAPSPVPVPIAPTVTAIPTTPTVQGRVGRLWFQVSPEGTEEIADVRRMADALMSHYRVRTLNAMAYIMFKEKCASVGIK